MRLPDAFEPMRGERVWVASWMSPPWASMQSRNARLPPQLLSAFTPPLRSGWR